jgi:preprotein translocase subunit SecF
MSKLSGIGGRLYRGETSYDFIGKRRRWYALSTLFLMAAVFALSTTGLKLGIEFKGGSTFTIAKEGATVAQANDALKSAGITTETVVQKVGTNKITIQTGKLSQERMTELGNIFAQKFNVEQTSISKQFVGPSWGKEISSKALRALVVFLIVVMIYLALAFEPKMAIAAIVAVIHDVLITVGIYALVGFDVTPATVIGFLTILGYSLYDTVVVFDKIRENTRSITSTGKMTYSQAANLGVNQTLVRSFNTSLIALLPVSSILFVGAGLLGAGTLKDLSLALFIGLATGTYSSIFIATPILAALREREPAMKALTKRVGQRSGNAVESKSTSVLVESAPISEKIKRGPRNQPKRKHR